MAYYMSPGRRFQRILYCKVVQLCKHCLNSFISNNNVTHIVIAKPKFSSAYNMSYAEVKYSDENANYVSEFLVFTVSRTK